MTDTAQVLDTATSPEFKEGPKEGMTHAQWKEAIEAKPEREALLELLSYLGIDAGFTEVKRSRVWEELRRAELQWDRELLLKVALQPEGPPDSKGWLWLLGHPQSDLRVLRRVGYLACTYGDKYYHGGRFARKALKDLSATPEVQAAKILAESMTLELARTRFVVEDEYKANFDKLFSNPSNIETFNRLHLDGWNGSISELIQSSVLLSN